MSSTDFLIKVQIGPVQEFIAQARSTRDLWSGSYLLSTLIAAGARQAIQGGGKLIFPNSEGQPLLSNPDEWKNADQKALLTPNLPNLFVAEIRTEHPKGAAEDIVNAIEKEWHKIASTCFERLSEQNILPSGAEADFLIQAESFLSISWQVTPIDSDYRTAYLENGRCLDAVRQTRDFVPNPINRMGEKDSLSGRDFAFAGGSKFKDAMAKKNGEYFSLFKHDDHLSSLTFIKRVWHLAYLRDFRKLKTDSKNYPIPSTRGIAARDETNDDDENVELADGEKYLAAIAFDGDSIGEWINGSQLPSNSDLKAHHSDFSSALSNFALGRAREIVSGHDGFLVYAGGDDVLALAPADAALELAEELRIAFREETNSTLSRDGKTPDASAGIAIGHFISPLQDLIQEAVQAEKRAKTVVGKPSFSITLIKRSGEISKWGAKWESQAIELHNILLRGMIKETLSSRFPYRIIELLTPYLTGPAGNTYLSDSLDPELAKSLTIQEFEFALDRQSTLRSSDLERKEMITVLNNYLSFLESNERSPDSANDTSLVQLFFEDLIELCRSVAFAFRNSSNS